MEQLYAAAIGARRGESDFRLYCLSLAAEDGITAYNLAMGRCHELLPESQGWYGHVVDTCVFLQGAIDRAQVAISRGVLSLPVEPF